MKRMWWFFMVFCLPLGAQAQAAITPSLVLEQVKPIKSLESKGDEIYFDINVYQANQKVSLVRVPEKPNHWPSSFISKLKQVPLWSSPLQTGESVILIVSLVDSDNFVLNPDDLIGSIKLEIKNVDGHLQSNWSIPNQTSPAIQNEGVQKFVLQSGETQYEVYLTLKS